MKIKIKREKNNLPKYQTIINSYLLQVLSTTLLLIHTKPCIERKCRHIYFIPPYIAPATTKQIN